MSIQWYVEVDGSRQILQDAAHLESLLQVSRSGTTANIVLERSRTQRRPAFEKFVYRMLGLHISDDTPLGTLELALAGDRALATFANGDDDDGVMSCSPLPAISEDVPVAFVTAAGEPYSESARYCIPRETALQAVREFFGTSKRPQAVSWVRTAKGKRR